MTFRASLLLLLTFLLGLSSLPSSGALFAASTQSTGTVGSARDWTPPAVAMQDPGSPLRGTVSLTATATDAETAVASVTIQSSPAGAGSWQDRCVRMVEPYTCPWSTSAVADGLYDVRALAVDIDGNSATSTVVANRRVDNTPPTVGLTVPGGTLSGAVVLTASPADAGSGVASVTIQQAIAGSGNWIAICTVGAAPWSCTWNTTGVANGQYDLRAVAVDVAQNSGTSAVVTRTVSNQVATVAVQDPGSPLRGTVTVTATASSPHGITSVTIQRRGTGAATWATLCVATSAPYTCSWATAADPDGSYELQAVLVDGSSSSTTSATVAGRQVDNTLPRGLDVQAADGGGTPGRLEAGDSITFAWTEVMRPGSLVGGWTGSGSANVVVRLRDGALVGGGDNDDVLDVFTSTTLETPVHVGSVALRGGYVNKSKTVLFPATLTGTPARGGVTSVTLTLGAPLTGTGLLDTWSTPTHMLWTPSSIATDTNGNACSATAVTESGALDRDF